MFLIAREDITSFYNLYDEKEQNAKKGLFTLSNDEIK